MSGGQTNRQTDRHIVRLIAEIEREPQKMGCLLVRRNAAVAAAYIQDRSEIKRLLLWTPCLFPFSFGLRTIKGTSFEFICEIILEEALSNKCCIFFL